MNTLTRLALTTLALTLLALGALWGGAQAQPSSPVYLPLVVRPPIPGERLHGVWTDNHSTHVFDMVAGTVTHIVLSSPETTPLIVLSETATSVTFQEDGATITATFLDDDTIDLVQSGVVTYRLTRLVPAPGRIQVNDVVCRQPTDAPTFEYIELVNNGARAVDLTGWKIINTSRNNATFTFPTYTIGGGPDIYVVVFGGIGTNRLDFGEFYWGDNVQHWHLGDTVEVRNAANVLVISYTVPQDSCAP